MCSFIQPVDDTRQVKKACIAIYFWSCFLGRPADVDASVIFLVVGADVVADAADDDEDDHADDDDNDGRPAAAAAAAAAKAAEEEHAAATATSTAPSACADGGINCNCFKLCFFLLPSLSHLC